MVQKNLERRKQNFFRERRSCVAQIFTARCLIEKYIEKSKDLYVAFMDLEKNIRSSR